MGRRARGLEVYVCTREAGHRALARDLGAAWVGDLAAPMPRAADGIIVFAPAGEVVPLALASLAPGGTVALAGIHMTDLPPLPYALLYRERGVRTVTNNTREDGQALLAAAGALAVRPAITTFPLAEAGRALLALKRGELRGSGVLLPTGGGV